MTIASVINKLNSFTQIPTMVSPNVNSMVGTIVNYKNTSYVTHTSLSVRNSAVKVFTYEVLMVLLYLTTGLVISSFLFGIKDTAIVLIGILTFIYFTDLVFQAFLIVQSFRSNPEIKVSGSEIRGYKKDWPLYTIFCPLYKEANVLNQFVKSIKNLDYPKNKLEVMLLLEEDDQETIQAAKNMDLPRYFKIEVVPNSLPRTKPKATNWGLGLTKGKYAVIYDAEDMPEADQLKKAVLAFQKINNPNTICIQAKLNFYNPRQNLLTKMFTAEYSLWFDLVLTGLQSINGPIPLGGTSNHFKTSYLQKIEGWDPFNVTEDCDLGIRIYKAGYQTAVFDSTTWEEANSKYGNWIRQRSRWIKGYIQTYLVHMKSPAHLTSKKHVLGLLYFQSIIGGKILSYFVNPLMWLMTITYFALRPSLGEQIATLFPSIIFYPAMITLVFGNFIYVYFYLIGCAKRGYWDLMKYALLMPFYWLMMSAAAGLSLYQLVFKPHFWEKTVHGLHLVDSKSFKLPKFNKASI